MKKRQTWPQHNNSHRTFGRTVRLDLLSDQVFGAMLTNDCTCGEFRIYSLAHISVSHTATTTTTTTTTTTSHSFTNSCPVGLPVAFFQAGTLAISRF